MKDFHKNLEKRMEFGTDNRDKNENIIKSFKSVLLEDKQERMLHADTYIERLASTGWKPTPSIMERWGAEDKNDVDKYIRKHFVGEQQNFGLSNISKDGCCSAEDLDRNLRLMADSMTLQRTITLEAQKIVRDAWAKVKLDHTAKGRSEKKPALGLPPENPDFDLNYNFEETSKMNLETMPGANKQHFDVGGNEFSDTINGMMNISHFVTNQRQEASPDEEGNQKASRKPKPPQKTSKLNKGKSDPVDEEFSASSFKRTQGGSLRNPPSQPAQPGLIRRKNPPGAGSKLESFFYKK